MSTELEVQHSDTQTSLRVLMENPPLAVLQEAATAASALKDVLAKKPKKVMMNGEQYLEFEDWQTLGRFYGITVKEDGDPEFVTLGESEAGPIRGFKASAVAIDRTGQELSRATAYCLSDEDKWGSRTKYVYAYCLRDGGHSAEDPGPNNIVWIDNPNKAGKKMPKKERIAMGTEQVPLFQLASMSQTRACAKAFRNVLSWVAVLAGYRPTPAEEIAAQADKHEAPPNPVHDAEYAAAEGDAPDPAPAAPAVNPAERAKFEKLQSLVKALAPEQRKLFGFYLDVPSLTKVASGDYDFAIASLEKPSADWGDKPCISLDKCGEIVAACGDIADPKRLIMSLAQINAPCDLPAKHFEQAMKLAKEPPVELRKVTSEPIPF